MTASVRADLPVVDASEMDAVVDRLHEVDLDRLEAAISAGAARIAALQCKWLLLLGEFLAREGFDRWGMTPEAWLSWRCGMERVTAREHLRVAARSEFFPRPPRLSAPRTLTFSKVRVIARIATPAR